MKTLLLAMFASILVVIALLPPEIAAPVLLAIGAVCSIVVAWKLAKRDNPYW